MTRKKNYALTYLSFTQKKTNHARDFAEKNICKDNLRKNLTLSRLGIPLPLYPCYLNLLYFVHVHGFNPSLDGMDWIHEHEHLLTPQIQQPEQLSSRRKKKRSTCWESNLQDPFAIPAFLINKSWSEKETLRTFSVVVLWDHSIDIDSDWRESNALDFLVSSTGQKRLSSLAYLFCTVATPCKTCNCFDANWHNCPIEKAFRSGYLYRVNV